MPRGKKYEKTEEISRLVRVMAQWGVRQKDIADECGISVNTLSKYYQTEYNKGAARAKAKLAEAIYDEAVIKRNTTALIFLCKTRLGWRETQKVDLTSSDGSMSPSPAIDFSGKSQEELLELTRAAFGLEHKD